MANNFKASPYSLSESEFLSMWRSRYPQFSGVDDDMLMSEIVNTHPQFKQVLKSYAPGMPREKTLDFSPIESIDERTSRNERQMPGAIDGEQLRDAGVWGKFFEGLLSGVSFGAIDLGYAEAEDTSEMLMESLGELTGAVPSFIAFFDKVRELNIFPLVSRPRVFCMLEYRTQRNY